MSFDMIKSYGIYDKNEINLNGYLMVLDITDVIKYSKENYQTDVFEIELYEPFLWKLCVHYLKDYYSL